jgi:Protein of unknown function (DUF4238)
MTTISTHSREVRKRNQHHVWQEYLRAWTTEGGIWCLQDDRVFKTGTSRLAVGVDFYKLQDWREEDRLAFAIMFPPDRVHSLLRDLNDTLMQSVFLPLEFVAQNRDRLNNLDLIDDYLDIHRTNAVDDYHTMIENGFLAIHPRLLAGDIGWYGKTDDCIRFLMFICAQHMRTRGIKQKTIEGFQSRMGLDISRVWDIAALMMVHQLSCSLFLERGSRRPQIIENTTAVPFVTGDQPTINLQGGDSEKSPEVLSFYYPLSPRLALYLGEPGEAAQIVEPITAESVYELNVRMAKESHSQIFAHASEPLLALREQLRAAG